ncbi:hypothetical protein A6R68_02897 [Neotoma lepida]|uniref:Uncharacterized protein n=1 Tax=Neotoma lepida TaxID=56216 RepID=A0A1A6GSC0_NEOLE|nr:hypothetical protein A6R68_02897 [Neotoma lepida]
MLHLARKRTERQVQDDESYRMRGSHNQGQGESRAEAKRRPGPGGLKQKQNKRLIAETSNLANSKAGERIGRAGRQREYVEGEIWEKKKEMEEKKSEEPEKKKKDSRGQPPSYTASHENLTGITLQKQLDCEPDWDDPTKTTGL